MDIRRLLVGLFSLACMAVASPASAEWYKAETDRFIVYGEGRESAVREYALKLQTFDAVLRAFHPVTRDRVPATKVRVYAVVRRDSLKRVRPGLQEGVAGFYVAMNEGVFAVAVTGEQWMGEDDVIFHEYTHHFMLENFPAAYPAWFVEGFAEYFATAEVKPDGVAVGGYNPARAYSVMQQTWVPLPELLSKTAWETRKDRRGAYYAQAWLLVHYMRSDPVRAPQLNKAITAIAGGADPVKAFEEATGQTIDQLTKALRGYTRLQRLELRLRAPESAVTVSRLPDSANDLLLENLRMILSRPSEMNGAFLETVRRRAAKYPGDELAEFTLARAEFTLGDVKTAESIIDRRLAARPDDFETLLLAGTGHLYAGTRDKDQRAAHAKAARSLLAKAYAANKQDFRALFGYVMARGREPDFPSANDVNVLTEARALAPSVQETSLTLGMALIKRGDLEKAKVVLTPLTNNPHGGGAAAAAKALIAGRSVAEAESAGEAAEQEDKSAAPTGSPQPAKAPAAGS